MDRVKGLVTGFEPFAGLPDNPASLVLAELASEGGDGCELVLEQVPVSLARAPDLLCALLARHRPDFVIALGLAQGAPAIRVETMAVNALAFGVPDNDGACPSDGRPIAADGPGGRAATWDGPAVVAAILAAGVPARLSFHAGTHMCNCALYTLVGALANLGRQVPCGFLHLPLTPALAVLAMQHGKVAGEAPSMGLADQLTAVRAAIAATAQQAESAGR